MAILAGVISLPESSARRHLWSRIECWLVFFITAAIILHVGHSAIITGDLVNWDGFSALAHAWDILFRETNINFALIGFVEPPAPALCYLPIIGAFPAAAQSGFAAVIFGAILLGLCAMLTDTFALRLHIPWWLRFPVIAWLVLNPISLSYAATGSPAVLLLLSVLGMAKSLAAWGDEQRLRDLIGCSLYAAIAILTRYEAILIVIAAAIFIAIRCVRDEKRPYSRIEGTLITFLLPATYFGGLWIVANWVIMGDPWNFLVQTFTASTSGAEQWRTVVLVVPILICPLAYALAWHELRPPVRWRGGAAVALLFAVALIVPIAWPAIFSALGSGPVWWPPLLSLTITTIASSTVLALHIVARYRNHTKIATEATRPIGGTVLLAAAGIAGVFLLRPMGILLPTTAANALTGQIAFAESAASEKLAAIHVRSAVQSGHRVFISGWPGFAIAQYSGVAAKLKVIPSSMSPTEAAPLLGDGDILIIQENLPAWQSAFPSYNLLPEWNAGHWQALSIKTADGISPPAAKFTTPSMRPLHALP